MSDFDPDDFRFRDLPRIWRTAMVDEWRSRTWYGKLKYPLWLLASSILWLGFFQLYLLLEGDSIADSIGDRISDALPDTHKDESAGE